MFIVTICWMLAMVSALLWPRRITACLTAGILIAWVATRPLGNAWIDWAQLAALLGGPWWLTAGRLREEGQRAERAKAHATEQQRLATVSASLLSHERETQALDAQIAQMSEVYRLTKQAAKALHRSEVFADLLTLAPRLLPSTTLRLLDLTQPAPIMFRATRTPEGRFMLNAPPSEEAGSASEQAGRLDAVEDMIRAQVESATPSFNAMPQKTSLATATPSTDAAWSILWREQRPIGALIAETLPEDKLPTLPIIANQLALHWSRVQFYEQVEALAVTDSLTGLWVRRAFLERAHREIDRAIRLQLPCAVLMVDLDHFKRQNDTYGHLVGDAVLRDVARTLQRHLRDIDLCARIGGEEFVLLLVDTPLEQAVLIGRRLQQIVAVQPIHAYDEVVTQTISIGVAAYPEHGQTLDVLMERADQALYAAKRAGRNQVIVWTEHQTEHHA